MGGGGRRVAESEISSSWKKSTFSESGQCVEVRCSTREVEVRDSLDPQGPHLRIGFTQWNEFLAWVAG